MSLVQFRFKSLLSLVLLCVASNNAPPYRGSGAGHGPAFSSAAIIFCKRSRLVLLRMSSWMSRQVA